MRTCRFCKKDAYEGDLVKYEVRHYAHFACYLDAGKRLDSLHAWQVGKFPLHLLGERNLRAEAERILDDQRRKDAEWNKRMGRT